MGKPRQQPPTRPRLIWRRCRRSWGAFLRRCFPVLAIGTGSSMHTVRDYLSHIVKELNIDHCRQFNERYILSPVYPRAPVCWQRRLRCAERHGRLCGICAKHVGSRAAETAGCTGAAGCPVAQGNNESIVILTVTVFYGILHGICFCPFISVGKANGVQRLVVRRPLGACKEGLWHRCTPKRYRSRRSM